jgi:hypothetical protein
MRMTCDNFVGGHGTACRRFDGHRGSASEIIKCGMACWEIIKCGMACWEINDC